MGKGNSNDYDVLYMPEVNPRDAYHEKKAAKKAPHVCESPTNGEIGSIVGCKECGKLWYFKFFPAKWNREKDAWYFVPVKWYNFGLKRRLK